MCAQTRENGESLPWELPGWDGVVEAWILDELAAQAIQVTGPIDFIHKRAWSAFASMATSVGTVYFKAPAPSLHFEAGLTQQLSRIRPDCMAELISVHPEQGWMLMLDSGEMLRQHINSVDDLHHWHHLLPLYAAFQRDLLRHVPQLLETGIDDRRLAIFPQLVEDLLQDRTNLRVDNPPGLSGAEYQRLLDLQPRISEQCIQLMSFNLPETICHEEVHDGNVLVDEGHYRFIDWSDSCVGHPFFTMLVTIRHTAYRLKLDEFAPEMVRLRDIYLDAWTDYGSPADLRSAFAIAYRLAMINRSLSYHQVLGPLPERYKVENDAIPGWLQDYLETVD